MNKILLGLSLLMIISCNTINPYNYRVNIVLENDYWQTTSKQNSDRMFFRTKDLSVIISLPFTPATDRKPYTYGMHISIEPMFHTTVPGKGTIKHKVISRYTINPTDVYLLKNGIKQECKLTGQKVQKYALLSTTENNPWIGSMDFLLPYAFSSLEGATIHIGGIEKDGEPILPLEFTIQKIE